MTKGNDNEGVDINPEMIPSRHADGMLQNLYMFIVDLGQTSVLQDIFDKSISSILEVLDVDRVSILTFDDEKVMRFRDWHNLSEAYRDAVEGHSPWSADEENPLPIKVPDVRHDPDSADLLPLFQEEGIRALAFIPLMSQKKLIGKFMIYYDQPHTFFDGEIPLAELIASHVGPAIERIQTRQALLKYAKQQGVLAYLGQQALTNFYRLPPLMDLVVQKTTEMLEVDFCELLMMEEDGKTLRLIAGSGWQNGWVGQTTMEVGPYSHAGFTLEQERPIVVRNFQNESRFEMSDLLRFHNTTSGMTVMIQGVERPFGVLGVHTAVYRHFSQNEVDFLKVLANILGVAVQQNKSLYALQSANDLLEARVIKRTTLLSEEITHRKEAEAILKRDREYVSLLQDIAKTANEALAIQDGFELILEKICEFADWPLAHIYIQASELLGTDSKDELVSSNIWVCQDHENFELIQQITTESRIQRGVSWVGKVFQTGAPSWSKNLSEDEAHPRNKKLHDLGVKAGYAFPLMVGFEVVAVMEFFTPEFKDPDPALIGIMSQIGTQMGRIVERERAKRQTKQNETSLRQLAGSLIQLQEEEQKRISHILHDDISQSLSALKLRLDMMTDDILDPDLKLTLDRARMMAKTTLEDIQTLAYDMRPPDLDTIGLDATLRDLCGDFAKRASFEVKYLGTQEVPTNLTDPINLSIYRAVQEGLTNAAKHSGATRVLVDLSYLEGELSISVSDNGKGLPQTKDLALKSSGLGLLGLSERFARLGGSVAVTSNRNVGTTLLAKVFWPIILFSQ